MSPPWQHFIFALFVQLLLPLMPLIIEFWITGSISSETYSISAAMYSISIGVTTKNVGLLGVSIFVAMAFSCVFGYVTSGNTLYFSVSGPALFTIAAFMLMHGTERYKRHVGEGERFIEIGGKHV